MKNILLVPLLALAALSSAQKTTGPTPEVVSITPMVNLATGNAFLSANSNGVYVTSTSILTHDNTASLNQHSAMQVDWAIRVRVRGTVTTTGTINFHFHEYGTAEVSTPQYDGAGSVHTLARTIGVGTHESFENIWGMGWTDAGATDEAHTVSVTYSPGSDGYVYAGATVGMPQITTDTEATIIDAGSEGCYANATDSVTLVVDSVTSVPVRTPSP